jgi:hypothetical protein
LCTHYITGLAASSSSGAAMGSFGGGGGGGVGSGDDGAGHLSWSNSATVILRRSGISMTFGIRD